MGEREEGGAAPPEGGAPGQFNLPVIDAHQHFWDLDANHLPWLRDEPPIPFRYGDYRALRRNYLPADYRCDAAGFHLVGSVFVEAEWDPTDPVGETRWVHALAAGAGLPSAMVCQARLDRADAAEVLAAQSGFPLVRGIRHKPAAAPSPDRVEPGAPGSMSDPAWRRGYARLAAHALSFDLQVPWWHLPEAAALNRDFPDTTIILNHTGLPADRSAEGLAGWRAAMRAFAACPNVAVKISGLGERGRPWSLERNREVILETVDLFGAGRCMFASNFPVDGLVGGFATIYGGFDAATREFGPGARRALFAGNARRIYRISG